MEQLDKNVQYELLNYQRYRQRLNKLFDDDKLKEFGISYKVLGKTTYNYPIDSISIGKGPYKLFLIGEIHGSEIITVDFITQMLSELKNMVNFDPNLFTLVTIPLLNPEGFEVTTSTLKKIDDTFTKDSKEYYLRYRMDSLFSIFLRDLNVLSISLIEATPDKFMAELNEFLENNDNVKKMSNENAIIDLPLFINEVSKLSEFNNYHDLQISLINIAKVFLDKIGLKEEPTINDLFFAEFLIIWENFFNEPNLWQNITNDRLKLHQQMFVDEGFSNISNEELQKRIEEIYAVYKHPLGSQATYDANGDGINLNANNKNNPGIDNAKNNIASYHSGSRDNIVVYVPGPYGISTKDPYNFEYTNENKALYKLLKDSYDDGSYLGTLLYHGTGGLIYYEPDKSNMDEEKYNEYFEENTNLANCYAEFTDYSLLRDNIFTGYGDLLRRKFPNVLLIELSKMGGNPISPYGDKENIIKCMQDNFKAIDNLLNYFSKKKKSEIKR